MRRLILLAGIFGLLGGLSLFLGMHQVHHTAFAASQSTFAQASGTQSVVQGLFERASSSWPWYLARVSGLVAAATLILLMLSGIGQITGHTFNFFEPITAWASHRALGIVFGISVLLHVGSIFLDHFVPFTLGDVLVPFLSNYKPIQLFGLRVGSVYIALGVLSLYLTFAIVVTSLLWVDKYPFLWKIIHLTSYVVMLFVFVHALYLGTDLASGLLRLVWIGLAVMIAAASLARLWRANTT